MSAAPLQEKGTYMTLMENAGLVIEDARSRLGAISVDYIPSIDEITVQCYLDGALDYCNHAGATQEDVSQYYDPSETTPELICDKENCRKIFNRMSEDWE